MHEPTRSSIRPAVGEPTAMASTAGNSIKLAAALVTPNVATTSEGDKHD